VVICTCLTFLLPQADAELASGVKKSALSTWLPYTLIDQVVAAADQDDVPPAAKALQLELKNDLKSRIKRMEKLSNRPR
jgi:nuclear pore complex protein Nup160